MTASPGRKKNPVGRPRKDGLPAGWYKDSKVAKAHAPALILAAPEATLQMEKRPRGRPRKDGTMPGSKRTGKASASAPVSQPGSEPQPSRHAPSQPAIGTSHQPKAWASIHPATEDSYNTCIPNPSYTAAEFDDVTDEKHTRTDDTEMGGGKPEGTERGLRRFGLDEEKKRSVAKHSEMSTSHHKRTKSGGNRGRGMFSRLADEDDTPAGKEKRAQTEKERREASRQRHKRACEMHDCYRQSCRINHARRENVAYFLQGLDERASQLNDPMETEAETEAPMEDGAAVEEGARPVYSMEPQLDDENQFKPLFSGIMQGRERDPTNWFSGEAIPGDVLGSFAWI